MVSADSTANRRTCCLKPNTCTLYHPCRNHHTRAPGNSDTPPPTHPRCIMPKPCIMPPELHPPRMCCYGTGRPASALCHRFHAVHAHALRTALAIPWWQVWVAGWRCPCRRPCAWPCDADPPQPLRQLSRLLRLLAHGPGVPGQALRLHGLQLAHGGLDQVALQAGLVMRVAVDVAGHLLRDLGGDRQAGRQQQ